MFSVLLLVRILGVADFRSHNLEARGWLLVVLLSFHRQADRELPHPFLCGKSTEETPTQCPSIDFIIYLRGVGIYLVWGVVRQRVAHRGVFASLDQGPRLEDGLAVYMEAREQRYLFHSTGEG